MGRPRKENFLRDVIDHTVKCAAQVMGVSEEDMLSKKRSLCLVDARCIAVFLLKETTPLSLTDIGTGINRHYSSVIHDYKRAQRRFIKSDMLYQRMLLALDMLEEYLDNRENILNFKTL